MKVGGSVRIDELAWVGLLEGKEALRMGLRHTRAVLRPVTDVCTKYMYRFFTYRTEWKRRRSLE